MNIGLVIDIVAISIGIGVGLIMIIGSVRSMDFVVNAPKSLWKYTFPDLLLKKMGVEARRGYYLLMGIALTGGMILYGFVRYL